MRNMKYSGIEWLGDIPEDWKLVKYKNFTINGMGNTILQTELVDEGIPVYSATKDNKIFGYIKEPKIKLFKGDLVISARGTIGCAKLIKDELATCTQTTIYSHIDGINNSYLYYCTIGLKEYWFEFDKTAIPQITVRQVDNNIVPVPSIEEQELIADYLDNKVKEIDNIISKTQETIEEYKKYKQSVITEVVTKGLNPDVEMKDIGIEWIGEVPTYWEKYKLKDYYTFEKGKRASLYTKTYIGENPGKYPVYSGQTENDGIMGKINSFDYDIDECIFTTTVGAKVMTPKILEGKFSLSQNCLIMKKIKKCNNHFIYYILLPLFNYKKSMIPSYMQPSLRISDLSGYDFCLPPLEEQNLIADYLDNKVKKIDNLIIKKQELITQLEQYKKSLIYECVTGKKEVSVSYAD